MIHIGSPARCRPLGIVGGVLLAIGAVAAGALPGPDPFADVALLAAVRREAALGLVAAIAGMGLLVTAWIGPILIAPPC